MKNIGFYSEDEMLDLLQDGSIDYVDFLLYSPQWHDAFSDYCAQRQIRADELAASRFMDYMELEEMASYNYESLQDMYEDVFPDLETAIPDLNFLN